MMKRLSHEELQQAHIESNGRIDLWLLQKWDEEGLIGREVPYILSYYSRKKEAFFFGAGPEDVVEHGGDHPFFLHSEEIKKYELAEIAPFDNDLYGKNENLSAEAQIHYQREAMLSNPTDIEAFLGEYRPS